MKAPYGFKQKRWYGLKRGEGRFSEILLVLSSYDGPIEKDYFYHHDLPIDPHPSDKVVELKLTTIKVVE
jgi:hypothetical protein